jgi:hypothetical protein
MLKGSAAGAITPDDAWAALEHCSFQPAAALAYALQARAHGNPPHATPLSLVPSCPAQVRHKGGPARVLRELDGSAPAPSAAAAWDRSPAAAAHYTAAAKAQLDPLTKSRGQLKREVGRVLKR